MKHETDFASIIEETLQDITLEIEQEEFCKFLKSDEVTDIIRRIYSFCLFDYENLNNLDNIKEGFREQLTIYFSQKEEISTIAPQLFSVLFECCQFSLDVIIKEEQDLSALDYKIRSYFKILAERLAKPQEQTLEEIRINRMLLREQCDKTEKSHNEIISLLKKLDPKVKDQNLEIQNSLVNALCQVLVASKTSLTV